MVKSNLSINTYSSNKNRRKDKKETQEPLLHYFIINGRILLNLILKLKQIKIVINKLTA